MGSLGLLKTCSSSLVSKRSSSKFLLKNGETSQTLFLALHFQIQSYFEFWKSFGERNRKTGFNLDSSIVLSIRQKSLLLLQHIHSNEKSSSTSRAFYTSLNGRNPGSIARALDTLSKNGVEFLRNYSSLKDFSLKKRPNSLLFVTFFLPGILLWRFAILMRNVSQKTSLLLVILLTRLLLLTVMVGIFLIRNIKESHEF